MHLNLVHALANVLDHLTTHVHKSKLMLQVNIMYSKSNFRFYFIVILWYMGIIHFYLATCFENITISGSGIRGNFFETSRPSKLIEKLVSKLGRNFVNYLLVNFFLSLWIFASVTVLVMMFFFLITLIFLFQLSNNQKKKKGAFYYDT